MTALLLLCVLDGAAPWLIVGHWAFDAEQSGVVIIRKIAADWAGVSSVLAWRQHVTRMPWRRRFGRCERIVMPQLGHKHSNTLVRRHLLQDVAMAVCLGCIRLAVRPARADDAAARPRRAARCPPPRAAAHLALRRPPGGDWSRTRPADGPRLPPRRRARAPGPTVACAPAAPKLVAVTAVAAASCAAQAHRGCVPGPGRDLSTSGPARPPASRDIAGGVALAPVLAARLAAAAGTPAARQGMRLARRYLRIAMRHHNPAALFPGIAGVAFSGTSWAAPKNGANAEIPHASLIGAPESPRVICRKPERGGFCR